MNANVVFDPSTPIGSLVMDLMPKAESLPSGKRQVSGTDLFILESKASALLSKLKGKRKPDDATPPEEAQDSTAADKIALIDQLLSRLGSLRQPAK